MPVLGERTLPTLVGEDKVPNGDSPAVPAQPPSLLVVPSIANVFAGPIPLSILLKARSTLGRETASSQRTDNTSNHTGKVSSVSECPSRILSGFFEYFWQGRLVLERDY